ncbi:MAG: hypothetical protein WAK17_07565 [Candidatus Nitrosopolaris sp.]
MDLAQVVIQQMVKMALMQMAEEMLQAAAVETNKSVASVFFHFS